MKPIWVWVKIKPPKNRGGFSPCFHRAIHVGFTIQRNPAPPQNPWNDDSPASTNKQWVLMVSKWCRISSIHSMFDDHRHLCTSPRAKPPAAPDEARILLGRLPEQRLHLCAPGSTSGLAKLGCPISDPPLKVTLPLSGFNGNYQTLKS